MKAKSYLRMKIISKREICGAQAVSLRFLLMIYRLSFPFLTNTSLSFLYNNRYDLIVKSMGGNDYK